MFHRYTTWKCRRKKCGTLMHYSLRSKCINFDTHDVYEPTKSAKMFPSTKRLSCQGNSAMTIVFLIPSDYQKCILCSCLVHRGNDTRPVIH